MANKGGNGAYTTKGKSACYSCSFVAFSNAGLVGNIMGKARRIFSRKTPLAPKDDEEEHFPPYEPFTINPDVLQELHDWNRRHPSDHLPSVLDRIARMIESKPIMAALDAIPPSPFPVGPLVKSLMMLIVFGIVCIASRSLIEQSLLALRGYPSGRTMRLLLQCRWSPI